MMNRRVFLAALAGLPIVGRFVPKKWPHVGEVPIRVMSETPCDWELFSRRLSLTDLELDQRYREVSLDRINASGHAVKA